MDRRPWVHPSITDAGEVRNAANGGPFPNPSDGPDTYAPAPIAS